MRSRPVRHLAAVLLFLTACAGPRPLPPALEQAELEHELDAFGSQLMEELVENRARLKNVEYALTRAAARHCGALARPRAGAIVARAASFHGEELRAIADREYGLGDVPTVVHVVPGGPFARAGIAPGDEILSLAGEPLESGGDLAQRMLDLGSADASVRMRVRRHESERDVDVQLVAACPIFFKLVDSTLIVPWQHETFTLEIPFGLLRFTASDDVLAVAAAHQLAPVLFEREEDDALASERRADRLGLRLAADAGYDIGVAPEYWEQVAREYPWLVLPQRKPARRQYVERILAAYPHPDIARRLAGIRATAAKLR